jgi:glycosyltransferase involved in cell wall biosynthesis
MHRLCILHPMDPRGSKVGGIETHVRLILSHLPMDMSVFFVGIDEIGDSTIGRARQLRLRERVIDFLPVARVEPSAVNAVAKHLHRSLTLRFALSAVRHLGAIRAGIGNGPSSCECQRLELAFLPKLLRRPLSLMLHVEGAKTRREDSLLQRYPRLAAFSERLALNWADHIFCVSPAILDRARAHGAAVAAKAEFLTVSVDTGIFTSRPFDCSDGVYRVLYAGRLDEAKNPALMFKTVARLAELLPGAVEFHYAGASEPSGFQEFGAIAHLTKRHGVLGATELADLAARCHTGILTSHFEGMPCFLLETLAVGRPFGAVRLAQFDAIIRPGISGMMVEAGRPAAETAEALAAALKQLWEDIRSGRLDHRLIARVVEPYSVETQMRRFFARHRELGDRRKFHLRRPHERVASAMTSSKSRS